MVRLSFKERVRLEEEAEANWSRLARAVLDLPEGFLVLEAASEQVVVEIDDDDDDD